MKGRLFEILFGMLVIAVLALLFIPSRTWETLVAQSRLLRVEEVHITCQPPLTEAKVLSWLPPLKGHNLWLVKASGLMKMLKAKPWVDSVVIKKEYPSRIFIAVSTKRARALKIEHGTAIVVDAYGRDIEKATPDMMSSLDLPVISSESEAIEDQWDLGDVMRVIDVSQQSFGRTSPISQVFLSAYPYFRLYLSSPPTELSFSLETWEGQLPRAALLLQHPPREIAQPRKINLVLAKKAIVSSLLSN